MRSHWRFAITAAALLGTTVAAAPANARSATQAGSPSQQMLPGPGTTWSLAAVGDAIITRRIAQFDHAGDPRFQGMVKVIREADAAMVNLELNLFRMSEFRGWPAVETGGGWLLGPPEAALDLQEMGFDFMNRANNHTTDWEVEGMRATTRVLDGYGIVHAGAGETLGEAARPGYLETAKGRIAFIGLATSFTNMSRAGEARPDMLGRPGLNGLRTETSYEADDRTFQALRAYTSAARFPGAPPQPPDQETLRVLGATVRLGQENRAIISVNAVDEARILREIRVATQMADYVVVTSHSHNPGNAFTEPPPWLVEFIKKCIDAGAATYVVHGPHQLRGIEIYKGRPIFYSLANFIFQTGTLDRIAADRYERSGLATTAPLADLFDAQARAGSTSFSGRVWWESVIAVPTFRGTQLVDLKLYPVDLRETAPRSQRGTPRLADEATGREIIDRLARLSEPFGTRIVYENGIGIWRPTAAQSSGR